MSLSILQHICVRPLRHTTLSKPILARAVLSSTVLRGCSLACLVASVPLQAQSYRVTRSGGALGKTLRVDLQGPNRTAWLMIPSLNAGPLPLSILDASDPRKLEVGLDLASLLAVGTFTTGKATLNYPIPRDNALAGRSLHFHGFLFPGSQRFAGTVSNPVRAALGREDKWTARGKVLRTAAAIPSVSTLKDGNVLLAGGGTGSLLGAKGLQTSMLYDADRQLFRDGPKMLSARALHHAITLASGKVLIIGGANQNGAALASCEVYDPATNSFRSTGSMLVPRAGHSATLLPNGKVLVCGGTKDLSDATKALTGMQRSCSLYDPKTGRWSSTGSMSRVRLGHGALLMKNGKVLVSGGATINFIFPGTTSKAEVYDPATGRWSGTGSMSYAAAAHSLALLPDGRVLSIGGAVLSGLNISSTNRSSLYDPKNGRWTAAGNLGASRTLPAFAIAGSGRLLAIGGAQGSLTAPKSLASCEWFDVKTLRWSSAPRMNIGRAGPIALQRPEGFIYIAGGAGGPKNESLDSGEILFLN